MKRKLNEIDQHTYKEWSLSIAKLLTASQLWKDSKVIGMTVSKVPEVNTIQLIEHAWKEGKEVCVPKCHPSAKTMTFRKITSFDQLEVVYYGLKEPREQITKEVNKEEIDLLLVPGLMYSENGYRLGFGGGYYDRYLKDYNHLTCSLAFPIQLVDDLPIEPFDLPVQYIFTNERVIHCGN